MDTRFAAIIRNVEALAPNKAYAVTVIVTKEGRYVVSPENQAIGQVLDLSMREAMDIVERRLNFEFSEEDEEGDAPQPSALIMP